MRQLIAVTLLLTAAVAGAAPCDDARHGDFDFWLGEWQVHTPDGQPAGHNQISREEGQCLLVERWRSVQGGTGQSYNFVEPDTGQWRQLWVSQGVVIDIRGGLTESGAMRLQGHAAYQANGTRAQFVGEWTPLPDGSVRQVFQQWDAAKEAWTDWFTGIYTRPDPPQDSD